MLNESIQRASANATVAEADYRGSTGRGCDRGSLGRKIRHLKMLSFEVTPSRSTPARSGVIRWRGSRTRLASSEMGV